MRKFEITITSPAFEGELFAVIEASDRGVADSVARKMLCGAGWNIDTADVGKVDQ